MAKGCGAVLIIFEGGFEVMAEIGLMFFKLSLIGFVDIISQKAFPLSKKYKVIKNSDNLFFISYLVMVG